jgi:hypothetical protein
MAEVISLRGDVPPGEAVPDIVQALRDLTERAERGEIHGFAFAMSRADGQVEHGWETAYGQGFRTAAAIMALQHRFAAWLLEEG